MKKTIYLVAICTCLLLAPLKIFAQFCTIPPLPDCSSCTQLTASNQNLNSGTYCVTTTVNNINISGSTVICISGAGKINGNLNGGTVIYNGGTEADPIGFGNLGGGTLRVRSNLTMNNLTAVNSNSTLIVENGATLTVSNIDINGTLIVDKSVLYVNNAFAVNGNGHVCFDNGVVNTSQFRSNDQQNSTNVVNSSGKGCFAVRNSFNGFNQTLTSSSNVSLCLPGTSVPNNTGSATINTNCSNASNDGGCYQALPVRLVSFQAQPSENGIRLDWKTSMESNFDYYQIERSTNAMTFEAVSPRIKSQGEQQGIRTYSWTDTYAKDGTYYYRLKQVDLDNTYSYSKIVGVILDDEQKGVSLRPNPFVNELNVTLNSPNSGTYVIELYNAAGKLITSETGEKSESVVTHILATSNLPTGVYVAKVRLGDQHFSRKIIKP